MLAIRSTTTGSRVSSRPGRASQMSKAAWLAGHTVVVTLARPDASWKYWQRNHMARSSKKICGSPQGHLRHSDVLVMGTGPWKFDSLDPTTGAELSANPHRRAGTSRSSTSRSRSLKSDERGSAFRAGEIDLDQQVLSANSFASTSGAKLMTTPSCDNGFFSMSTQTAPWSDVHVRRAAAYALNRAAIITAAGGYASPIYTLIPLVQLRTIASATQVNSLLNSVPLYQYNVTKGKEEMAESAYPHGVTATMLGDDSGTDSDVEQVIAAELQAVGIHVQFKVLPTGPTAPG